MLAVPRRMQRITIRANAHSGRLFAANLNKELIKGTKGAISGMPFSRSKGTRVLFAICSIFFRDNIMSVRS